MVMVLSWDVKIKNLALLLKKEDMYFKVKLWDLICLTEIWKTTSLLHKEKYF